MASPSMTSARFALLVAALGEVARECGLRVPGFRSPPRRPGCTRVVRWQPGGEAIVAVAIADRSEAEIVTDMIEGVVVANALSDGGAVGVRTLLGARLLPARPSSAYAA